MKVHCLHALHGSSNVGTPNRAERPLFVALFGLFLFHLLLYVWLVPPWQHYDEPTHLEYALLIRELGRVPTLDEQIPELRRSIANSMIDGGFFRNPNLPLTAPNPNAPELSLGVNERGHPPLYYALVALGTLPVRTAPIEVQLRAARCVSVVLAALLFVAAYWLLRLLTGDRWGLRCAVLAALALQPAFIDNCSAVNSDVLANLVAVLLLLVGVGVLRRPGWRMAALSVFVIVLAWNVKRTLLVYSLLIPAAWLMVAPRSLRRGGYSAAGVAVVAVIAWLIAMPWPLADWRGSTTALVARPSTAYAGRSGFTVRGGEALTQKIYLYRVAEIGAKPVTLAAWMRADQSITATSPVLTIGEQAYSHPVQLDSTWKLITVTALLRDTKQPVEIALRGATSAVAVEYDSIALVAGPGSLPGEQEPDGAYEAGILGTTPPRNLARNAGAERRIPPLPAPLVALFERRISPEGFGQALSSLSNPRWIAAVYPRQFWLLFVGVWGIFGWGQYTVSSGWFTPLALLAAASAAGAGVLLLRSNVAQMAWQRKAWWLCAFAVVLGWGVALARVHNQPFPGVMFWSFGRYTFVAMLPSLLFFVAGFRAIFPASLRNQATAAQLGLLAVFGLVAITSFGL